jgi:hypothetical protein
MSRLNPVSNDPLGPDPQPMSQSPAVSTNGLGTPPLPPENPAPVPGHAAEGPSSLERAAKMADRVGVQVGVLASVVGQKLIRFAAWSREYVEDMWAEAQNIRRGEKNEPPANP